MKLYFDYMAVIQNFKYDIICDVRTFLSILVF